MSSDLALVPILRRIVEATGLVQLIPDPEEIDRGLAQIEAALRRVAVEADDAATHGLSLSEASRDDVNYPSLHRLHMGVPDILTMALTPELVAVLERAMDEGGLAMAEEIQKALGHLAIAPDAHPVTRALGRVLLFEGLRMNLIAQEYLSGRSLIGQGLDANHLDRLAEEELAWWIENRPDDAGEVRPLNVLVGTALLRLEYQLEAIRPYLHRFSDEIVEQLKRREEFELALRRMDTADALLIRNDVAPALGEQRLKIERLRDQHRLALGGRKPDALYQQARRLRARGEDGALPERKGPALIDLLERRLKEEDR